MNRCHECDTKIIEQFFESEETELDPRLSMRLETCSQCRAYFDKLAADFTMWEEANLMLQRDEFDVASRVDPCRVLEAPNISKDALQSVLDILDPTDDPHQLGRLGGYEISGVIGVGGMGVVLKGFDLSLDRVIAIKLMAPQLANNKNARKRFSREARAAAAILHPNVIPIHSVNESGKVPFLVMAYIRGESLQGRLDRQGPLNIEETLRIGTQIAAGLAAAHEQGLVHRDIKPENILLEGGVERVTITDFGLARAVDDHTITQLGTITGTPQYMSPEQALGEPIDQQSDLFSLGSVLYTACTGRPPFDADSSLGVMRKIVDETPVPIPSSQNSPWWLAAIIEKLMSKDKTNRFESAAAVRSLLERCLGHVQEQHAIALPLELSRLNQAPKGPNKFYPIPTRGVIGIACSILFVTAICTWCFSDYWKSASQDFTPVSSDAAIHSILHAATIEQPDSKSQDAELIGLTYDFSNVPPGTWQLLGFRPAELDSCESTKNFSAYFESLIFPGACEKNVVQLLTADYSFGKKQCRIHLVKVRGCASIDFLRSKLGVGESEVDPSANYFATNREGIYALMLDQNNFALGNEKAILSFLRARDPGKEPKIVSQASEMQDGSCFGFVDLTASLAQEQIWTALKNVPNIGPLSDGLTPFLDCTRFSFALASDNEVTSIQIFLSTKEPNQQARIEKSVHLFLTYVGNVLESGNALIPPGLRLADLIKAFHNPDVVVKGDSDVEARIYVPSKTKELWVIGMFFPELYRLSSDGKDSDRLKPLSIRQQGQPPEPM